MNEIFIDFTYLQTLIFPNFDFILQKQFYQICCPVIRLNLKNSSKTLNLLSKNHPRRSFFSIIYITTDLILSKKEIVDENCVIACDTFVWILRFDEFQIDGSHIWSKNKARIKIVNRLMKFPNDPSRNALT